jgi:hypothetical protein
LKLNLSRRLSHQLKPARMVETLRDKGPFTVFAANAGMRWFAKSDFR